MCTCSLGDGGNNEWFLSLRVVPEGNQELDEDVGLTGSDTALIQGLPPEMTPHQFFLHNFSFSMSPDLDSIPHYRSQPRRKRFLLPVFCL